MSSLWLLRAEEENSMDELIKKAKDCVEKRWPGVEERPWLEAEPPDSYKDPFWRVRLFVLQGSPPKGFVLANYGTHTVKAFNSEMKHLYTFKRRGLYWKL
jgi:hypothetical protein